jgi:hypothetical protein
MKGNISIAGNSDATLIGVSALVFVGLFLFLKQQGTAAAKAVANVNKGTPYEGTGAVGTLGNVANQISGGSLASIGESLGSKVYDLFNSDPVASSGTVLQTSKQAVADNAANAPTFNWVEDDPTDFSL